MCDYEEVRVCVTTMRKARIPHLCSECGWVIRRHVKYADITGIDHDRAPFRYRVCVDCTAWSDAVLAFQRQNRNPRERACGHAFSGLVEFLEEWQANERWTEHLDWRSGRLYSSVPA